mmetsp:Transcript_26773/g.57602  ORF Transcript_26773/g.57602 Transcript_26773/m.57602 type:complete len:459 (+) Transcript_26773:89-1465(+)
MVTPPAAYATAVTPPGNRPHSIAVFGCTGNAGRAVAYQSIKSAAKKPNNNIHVALSGRNRAKVEKVLDGIIVELRSEGIHTDDTKVDIIIADASDEESMLKLAKSTKILVSCAGPYMRYGETAVKACVEGGAHYVDITGEVAFIEKMISQYGGKAEDAGVALCPFSGYDCVPAELAMWLVSKALEMEDAKLGDLALNFRAKGGGLPRGTIDTILDGADGKGQYERKDGDERFYPKEYRKTAKDALSLSNFALPKYQLGQCTGPNFMSVINVPVLCRAAPILGISSDLTVSDRSVVSGAPTFLNGYGMFGTLTYIATLFVGAIAFAVPPVRGTIRNRLKGYSFNGNPAGKVFVDASGLSLNKKSTATAKCVFPGDAGIYATGHFAAGVANALLDATSSDSSYPMPLAGFHSPVAALDGCRQGLLADHLKDMGAEIKVEVITDGDVTAKIIDVTKLRSKL